MVLHLLRMRDTNGKIDYYDLIRLASGVGLKHSDLTAAAKRDDAVDAPEVCNRLRGLGSSVDVPMRTECTKRAFPHVELVLQDCADEGGQITGSTDNAKCVHRRGQGPNQTVLVEPIDQQGITKQDGGGQETQCPQRGC